MVAHELSPACRTAFTLLLLALIGSGCLERQGRPVSPCTTSEVSRRIAIETVDTVDLLLMVDNSNSMDAEQERLRREIPRMIAVLASGDRNGDGIADFTAVRSMHVGIVTSDMGAGDVPPGEMIPSCRPGLGDDGVMRSNGADGVAGCLPNYPSRVFDFDRSSDDPRTFAADVGCVAVLGTGGCGYEQQLEASLKALSPASPQAFVASFYTPPAFYGGTLGHGDGMNNGFLRSDSALAIVLVTDEEDCSVPAYNLFYQNDPAYSGTGINLRCSTFDSALYPVSRYVDGFRQLRENPGLLIYAPIVGLPPDLADSTYEAMLADPRLTEVEDTSNDPPIRLLPSCSTPPARVGEEPGAAYPPRRIIEVARGLRDLGASTTVQSICAESFTPAIDVIIAKIADALSGACLPRPLNQSSDGTVGCDVYELLPAPGGTAAVTTCADANLELVDVEAFVLQNGTMVTRELCLVPQVTPSAGTAGTERGWYYDNESSAVRTACSAAESSQRIAFSNLMPPTGAEVRLTCNQAILPSSGDSLVQLGTFCDPDAPVGPANQCAMGSVPSMSATQSLTCDDVTRTCGVRCVSDADCVQAGLLSYVCDDRSILEVVGALSRLPDRNGDSVVDDRDHLGADGNPILHNYCVNPTCGN